MSTLAHGRRLRERRILSTPAALWAMAGAVLIALEIATSGFWRHSLELLEAIPAGGRTQLAGDVFGRLDEERCAVG